MLRASIVVFFLACVAALLGYGGVLRPGAEASMASLAFIILVVIALLMASIGVIPSDARNRSRVIR